MHDAGTFPVILIKPSHYDDDGYVIRWRRSVIPSNSLAAVYGLVMDCADRDVAWVPRLGERAKGCGYWMILTPLPTGSSVWPPAGKRNSPSLSIP